MKARKMFVILTNNMFLLVNAKTAMASAGRFGRLCKGIARASREIQIPSGT
jgi:hypothetical protein